VLGIALTDTFGTPAFLQEFKKTIPVFTAATSGGSGVVPSSDNSLFNDPTGLSTTLPPIHAPINSGTTVSQEEKAKPKTYAEVFSGVRQDSGDPTAFMKIMREFYDEQGIKGKKAIVFSDSLNVEKCLEYMTEAEEAGFLPSFGVGTFLTNDFTHKSDPSKKSDPLNIVIKLSSARGEPAIKISDNIGKNTGDRSKVQEVKGILGYTEATWKGGDEEHQQKKWEK
jgi:nicotinate phosphoribosyltransferase